MTETKPVKFRLILAELFGEAESKGLGTLHVGFTATPGMENEAADYIERRTEFVAQRRFAE